MPTALSHRRCLCLPQIAHLMGRIPVMPLLSCRSPFLGPDGHTFFHNITFDYNRHGVLPADDEVYPEAAEMCYIWDYGKDGCVQEVGPAAGGCWRWLCCAVLGWGGVGCSKLHFAGL